MVQLNLQVLSQARTGCARLVADSEGKPPKGRHVVVSPPDVIFPEVATVEIALVAGETMEFNGIPRIMERMRLGCLISKGHTEKSLIPKARHSPYTSAQGPLLRLR